MCIAASLSETESCDSIRFGLKELEITVACMEQTASGLRLRVELRHLNAVFKLTE